MSKKRNIMIQMVKNKLKEFYMKIGKVSIEMNAADKYIKKHGKKK